MARVYGAYEAFRRVVTEKGWTLAQLRCDSAPPSPEMWEVMERVGLADWERFVLRLEREAAREKS